MSAKFLVKSLISSTIIIGGGYLLMVGVMPSEQELRQRIEKSRPVEKVDKLVHQAQMRAIMENVNSDRPIWDVRFPTKQDLVPNDSIVESKTPVGSPRI